MSPPSGDRPIDLGNSAVTASVGVTTISHRPDSAGRPGPSEGIPVGPVGVAREVVRGVAKYSVMSTKPGPGRTSAQHVASSGAGWNRSWAPLPIAGGFNTPSVGRPSGP